MEDTCAGAIRAWGTTIVHALGAHEAFRRLGYRPESIFAIVDGAARGLLMRVTCAGEHFDIAIGKLRPDEIEHFSDVWAAAAAWWNTCDQDTSSAVFDAFCSAAGGSVGLLLALSGRGFPVHPNDTRHNNNNNNNVAAKEGQ